MRANCQGMLALALAACGVPDTTFAPTPVPDAPVDARAADAAPDAPAPDAVPDAAPDAPVGPMVTAVDQPPRIAAGDTVTVRFTVHAVTHGTVTWAVHAAAGTFAPASGTADLDASGDAAFTATYTAAATAGDDPYTVDLDDGTATHADYTAKVRDLVLVGESTAFADHQGLTVGADILYGQPVTLAAQAYVMRLGLFSDSAGYAGRIAVYLDHGGMPATLVAETQLQPIAAGRNELRLAAPVALNAGTYWLMGNFSGGAQVRRGTAAVGQMYLPLASSAAFPATTAGSTALSGKALNYFAEVIP